MLRKQREILLEFLPKRKYIVGITTYGFTKDLTLIYHVTKPNKAVILIYSMHHQKKNR